MMGHTRQDCDLAQKKILLERILRQFPWEELSLCTMMVAAKTLWPADELEHVDRDCGWIRVYGSRLPRLAKRGRMHLVDPDS
jgi:hypothetical protein